MLDRKWYTHRERTYIKHFILESYLEKLAFKVGWWCDTINYIDCFAGPWKQEDDDLSDTSPFIAINKLRQVRSTLAKHGKNPRLRCLFVEKKRESWELLEQRISDVHDVECRALLGEFEDHIHSIVNFCGRPSSKNFSFFFIDPTGWTGSPSIRYVLFWK